MIDANVYARYMTAIADRLKAPLADGTNALYYVTLSQAMDDEQFEYAAAKVFAEYDDFGFPPPAIFLDALKSIEPRRFDVDATVRKIEKLATYHPSAGLIPPIVATVRAELGDVVGDAYATVGGSRLFADDVRSRETAQRDLGKYLEQYAKTPEVRPLLPKPPEVRKIRDRNAAPESVGALLGGVMKQLPSEPAA